VSFTISLAISAAPTKVFDAIADFTRTPEWYSAVKRVDRVEGTGGLGTRYAVHRDLPGGPVVNTVAVTSYTDGAEVGFTSISGPTPFVYRYLIEPTGTSTRLTLEGTISAAGLGGPASHLGGLAESFFKRGMRKNLSTLAALLER